MQYSPVQKNSRVVNAITVMAFMFGGIAYAIPSVCGAKGIPLPMPWLFSLLTLGSVVTALYFIIRYKMTGFIYMIRPRNDSDDPMLEAAFAGGANVSRMPKDWVDFVAMKSQGSRAPVMECVLSFGDLAEIVPVTRKGGFTPSDCAKKYRERSVSDFAFYDYTLTFRWENALELVFIDGQRYVGIIIEADEEFEAVLRSVGRLGN